jgi:hypothetical protein
MPSVHAWLLTTTPPPGPPPPTGATTSASNGSRPSTTRQPLPRESQRPDSGLTTGPSACRCNSAGSAQAGARRGPAGPRQPHPGAVAAAGGAAGGADPQPLPDRARLRAAPVRRDDRPPAAHARRVQVLRQRRGPRQLPAGKGLARPARPGPGSPGRRASSATQRSRAGCRRVSCCNPAPT